MLRLTAIFVVMMLAAAGAQARNYSSDDPRETHFDIQGAQVESILIAWQALRTEHEHDALLSEFSVAYTSVEGGATTIAFFKRPSLSPPLEDGSVTIHTYHRYYQVVVEADGAHVLPRNTE